MKSALLGGTERGHDDSGREPRRSMTLPQPGVAVCAREAAAASRPVSASGQPERNARGTKRGARSPAPTRLLSTSAGLPPPAFHSRAQRPGRLQVLSERAQAALRGARLCGLSADCVQVAVVPSVHFLRLWRSAHPVTPRAEPGLLTLLFPGLPGLGTQTHFRLGEDSSASWRSPGHAQPKTSLQGDRHLRPGCDPGHIPPCPGPQLPTCYKKGWSR